MAEAKVEFTEPTVTITLTRSEWSDIQLGLWEAVEQQAMEDVTFENPATAEKIWEIVNRAWIDSGAPYLRDGRGGWTR